MPASDYPRLAIIFIRRHSLWLALLIAEYPHCNRLRTELLWNLTIPASNFQDKYVVYRTPNPAPLEKTEK